jgi:TatD DNase family protein
VTPPSTPPAGEEPLPAPGAFDSHSHMDIMGLPVDGVLAAARVAGIGRVVTVGCDLPSSRWSVSCAAEYEDVYAAVAIHPNEVLAPGGRLAPGGTTPQDPPAHGGTTRPPIPPWPHTPAEVLAELESLASSPTVVAIGETGLDYYRDNSPPAVQREWFLAHIGIARRTGKALMIHDREAHADVLAILADEGPWPPYSVIFHCFSGDAQMAARCAEAGYVMSFAGNVTFKNAGPLRAAAEVAPAELILAETDAPFLTPVPHRGKPNSPAMTAHTIRALAALKGMDVADLCTHIQSTGARVFGW